MTYNAKVSEVPGFFETPKGTKGFGLIFETADGDTIEHTLWVTVKAAEAFWQALAIFGVSRKEFRDQGDLEERLPHLLLGKELSFSTKLETWKDESKIKVGFIGKKRSESQSSMMEEVADILGIPKTARPLAPLTGDAGGEDDDIPF